MAISQSRQFRRVALLLFIAMLLALILDTQFSFSHRAKSYASFFFENATPATVASGRSKHPALEHDIAALHDIFVTKYVAWHGSGVNDVKLGRSNSSSLRTLVFIGNGRRHGLGDRLRGILYAYICAVFSERVLLIKWDEPYPLSTVFDNGIGTNFTYDPVYFPPATLANGTADEVYVSTAKYMHDLDMFTTTEQTVWMLCEPRPVWKGVFNLVKQFPKLETSRRIQQILPLNARPRTEEFFPLLFRALFRSSRKLRKMMSEPIAAHNRFSVARLWKTGPLRRINLNHPYISVHARLGKGVGENIKRFDTGRTLATLAKCMANQAHNLASSEGLVSPPRFYLATDTKEFRVLFKRALRRLNPDTKMMYGSWNVKHTRDLRKHNAADLRQYMYAFMDLYLLSKGKAIICADSGFCNLAIWMGRLRKRFTFKAKQCPYDE